MSQTRYVTAWFFSSGKIQEFPAERVRVYSNGAYIDPEPGGIPNDPRRVDPDDVHRTMELARLRVRHKIQDEISKHYEAINRLQKLMTEWS